MSLSGSHRAFTAPASTQQRDRLSLVISCTKKLARTPSGSLEEKEGEDTRTQTPDAGPLNGQTHSLLQELCVIPAQAGIGVAS